MVYTKNWLNVREIMKNQNISMFHREGEHETKLSPSQKQQSISKTNGHKHSVLLIQIILLPTLLFLRPLIDNSKCLPTVVSLAFSVSWCWISQLDSLPTAITLHGLKGPSARLPCLLHCLPCSWPLCEKPCSQGFFPLSNLGVLFAGCST